jgi:hypothetical protein
MKKTVFFGPFIGEFGWEIAYWQGWVRRVCREEFKDYRKIASSFPGREPFYPEVDEFWPVSEEFQALEYSAHAYYTDGWRGGLPGVQFVAQIPRKNFVDGRVEIEYVDQWSEKPLDGEDIEPLALAMLAEFEARLPDDARVIVPWKFNQYDADGIEFGVRLDDEDLPYSQSGGPRPRISLKIHLNHQTPELLKPTAIGRDLFASIIGKDDRPLIALFPRKRDTRRPDKNWPKEKYDQLIPWLQSEYPHYVVAIFGIPGGSEYVDVAPPGCIDLINISDQHRTDIQLAGLGRSVFATGAGTGGHLLSVYAGCPTIFWSKSFPQTKPKSEIFIEMRELNPLKTPMYFYPNLQPEVTEAQNVIKGFEMALWNCLDDKRDNSYIHR